MKHKDLEQLIKEYSPSYCQSLEMAYGPGLMSEGGDNAIDELFSGFNPSYQKALDIGAGFGKAACYLANTYHMQVTGVEINPWLVKEANERALQTPNVEFILSTNHKKLDFADNQFDIVYSKGVLTHLKEKQDLFKECNRVLKPKGRLIINDWLSPIKNLWGSKVKELILLDDLSIHAEDIDGYIDILKKTNFSNIEAKNLSNSYAIYNQKIVDRLKTPYIQEKFIQSFGKKYYQETVAIFQITADAMLCGEIEVYTLSCQK